jgi:hypothetical protein
VAALTALSVVEPELAWLEDPDGAPGAGAPRPGFLGAPTSGAYLSPPPRASGAAGAGASERPPPREGGDAADEGGAGGDDTGGGGAGDDGGWVPIVTLSALRRELALARARAAAAGGGSAGGGGGRGGVGAWSSAEDVAEALMAQGARLAPAGARFDTLLTRIGSSSLLPAVEALRRARGARAIVH